MFKKIKFCFKTSDYEMLNYDDYFLVIKLDYKKIFYGFSYKTKDTKIKNGEVINIETGIPEICDYKDCTMHNFWIYYKLPKSEKPIWFKYHYIKFKQKV